MTEEGDHRHCRTCGRSCDPDAWTCSPACAAKRADLERNRRNYTYLLYGTIALVAILLFSHYL